MFYPYTSNLDGIFTYRLLESYLTNNNNYERLLRVGVPQLLQRSHRSMIAAVTGVDWAWEGGSVVKDTSWQTVLSARERRGQRKGGWGYHTLVVMYCMRLVHRDPLEAWQQPRVADQGNCLFHINIVWVIATCWDYQVQKFFSSSSSWFILCCHGSIGHEIGGRAFSGMSKRDPRLFVYCLRALTHPARYLMLVQISRLSFSD